MSILDMTNEDFDNVVEPEPVEPGEYQLKILEVKQDKDKNDEPYLLPRFEVVDQPTSKDFTKFIRLPHTGLDEKKMNNAKLQLKRFADCFGVDLTAEIDLDDLAGFTGWALLGIDPQEDTDYGPQNYIKQYIVGA